MKTDDPSQRRVPCRVCVVLLAACAVLTMALLSAGMGPDVSSCRSLESASVSVEEACQVAYGEDVHAASVALTNPGRSYESRCSNGAFVGGICLQL